MPQTDSGVPSPLTRVGTFRVQADEEDYRLVGPGGEEGALVEYGQPAALAIGSAIYYALMEDPDQTEATVFRVDQVTPMSAEVQEVEFQYPEDEEEGEEEEDPVVVAAGEEEDDGTEKPAGAEEEEEED